MIPIHIWNNSQLIDLRGYPDQFYELFGGRGSDFLRPIIHPRRHRLNYEDAGEFGLRTLSKKGEASMHIFVLSHHDLLQGPSNNVLGQICETILKTAQVCTRLVVMFLAVLPEEDMNAETISTVARSKEKVEAMIRTHPIQATWVSSQIFSSSSLALASPYNEGFQAKLYKELTKLICRVTVKDKFPKLNE